jgi:hypothetical protein
MYILIRETVCTRDKIFYLYESPIIFKGLIIE